MAPRALAAEGADLFLHDAISDAVLPARADPALPLRLPLADPPDGRDLHRRQFARVWSRDAARLSAPRDTAGALHLARADRLLGAQHARGHGDDHGRGFSRLCEDEGLAGADDLPALRHTQRAAAAGHVRLPSTSVRLISGQVLVETIFGYPGVGMVLYNALRTSDFFVVQGVVLFVIFAVALAMMLVDFAYPLLDPRVRYERAQAMKGLLSHLRMPVFIGIGSDPSGVDAGVDRPFLRQPGDGGGLRWRPQPASEPRASSRHTERGPRPPCRHHARDAGNARHRTDRRRRRRARLAASWASRPDISAAASMP